MKKIVFYAIILNLCYGENVVLKEIVVTDLDTFKTFNSSNYLNKEKINLITSKYGSITEILKTNPNITFSKNVRSSTESGEISPKYISINGASHYQNNFLVDNINFNDDISSTGYKNLFKNVWQGPSLGTQAINLNVDLLKSVEVFDSFISAKYGDFQGGVIKTKDPSTKFSGITNFGCTNGNWQKTFCR